MQWLRFRLDIKKCIEGIQLLAVEQPGITQYYVGKIFFFADRAHLADWGRPISGDRYVAMEHGPVPSSIRDLLKTSSEEPDEIVDEMLSKVELVREGNKIKVFSKEKAPSFLSLSGTDIECLRAALKAYGDKSFGYIKNESHKDVAYESAWANPGINNEMDLRMWFSDDQLAEIYDTGPILRRA